MTTGEASGAVRVRVRVRALADVIAFCALVVAIYFVGESVAVAHALDAIPRSIRLPTQAFAMAQLSVVPVLAIVARDGDMAASLGLGRIAPVRAVAGGIALWLAIIALAIGVTMVLVVARSFEHVTFLAAPRGFGSTPDDTRLIRELAQIEPLVVVPLACFVGFYEELLFRGFLLNRLRSLFGERVPGAILAVGLSAALFALGHTYKSAIGIFATFLIGVILGIASWRMRSIWACILAHALIDTMALLGARIAAAAA